jgi:hypothetical protein
MVLFENLVIAQLAKKFILCLESEVSLLCLCEPSTGPYLDPDESGPNHHILFL